MRGESGVNFSLFLLLLSVRMGNSVSLRRRREEETKSQRVKESKRRRDKKTKRQSDEGSKRQREEETKRRRDKKTKRRRDEERKRQRDEKTKTASPPIHLLFTSYSCPLHRLFTAQFVQILFNSCPKTFARFVSKTVLHQRTPLCESSVKVNVGGKVGAGGTGKEKAQ